MQWFFVRYLIHFISIHLFLPAVRGSQWLRLFELQTPSLPTGSLSQRALQITPPQVCLLYILLMCNFELKLFPHSGVVHSALRDTSTKNSPSYISRVAYFMPSLPALSMPQIGTYFRPTATPTASTNDPR